MRRISISHPFPQGFTYWLTNITLGYHVVGILLRIYWNIDLGALVAFKTSSIRPLFYTNNASVLETSLLALMSVCRLVGWFVCHNFKFHFPCSYRSTCWKINFPMSPHVRCLMSRNCHGSVAEKIVTTPSPILNQPGKVWHCTVLFEQ